MNKEELARYVGSKIKDFRTSRGMTQEELAELMNTTKQTIGRYENGLRRANQDNIFDLAEIFNRSINDFFPDVGENEHNITTTFQKHLQAVISGYKVHVIDVFSASAVTSDYNNLEINPLFCPFLKRGYYYIHL